MLAYDNVRVRDLAPRFHWPDETTNAFFATRVARGESFVVPEPRNVTSGNLVHPRTTNVRSDGAIVPGSYLGLPLWYGLLGRVGGERILGFVTPLLAAGGLFAFAWIMRAWVGWRIAAIAASLLALHPSLWLFTATSFLPNVPFVALLLIGYAMFVGTTASNGSHCVVRWILGGFAIGLALTIRTHELLWVLAIGAAFAWRERPGWRVVMAAGAALAVPFLPILVLQSQIYGHPFTTGYAILRDGGTTPTEFTSRASWLPGWLAAMVAPFGWDVARAFTNAWRYVVVPYPWLLTLAALGMIVGAVRGCRGSWTPIPNPDSPREVRKAKWEPQTPTTAILSTIAVVLWLILYYGSWELADPLVRSTNILTISYVRYWLPIVVILAPWAAMGFVWIVDRAPVVWRSMVGALLLLAVVLASTGTLVGDPIEGFLRQRAALAEHRVRARAVIAATPSDAVVISDRLDKAFFPERGVVHASVDALRDRSFRERLAGLVGTQRDRVYWYSTGPLDIPTVRVRGPLPGIDVEVPTMKIEERRHAGPFGERLYQVTSVLTDEQ